MSTNKTRKKPSPNQIAMQNKISIFMIKVLSLVLGLLIIVVIVAPDTESPRKQERELEEAMSANNIMCQMFVNMNLKSPRTAKYPINYDDYISMSDDAQHMTINSHVDSQNGFGAMIRTPYLCKFKHTPSTEYGWELDHIKVGR